jgi:hypothetical protein
LKPGTYLIVLLCIISSCRKYAPSVYEVVGMRLSNCDNTGARPIDATTDSVPMNAYAIKITLDQEMRKKSDDPESESGSNNEDKLTSFELISLNDFDATHPAGTSLNAYFLSGLGASATIESLVSKGQIGSGSYNNSNAWTSEKYLFLMTPPSTAAYQSFVLTMGFSDGRHLSDTVKVRLY